MGSKKRPSLKGKGMDFFLEEKKTATSELTQEKATFYLPPSLLDSLDKIWLDLRRKNRKLKKSDIARIALEKIIQNYEEKRQDSILLKHLTDKTS